MTMPDTHPNEARRLGEMLRMQVRAMCQVSSTEGVNAAVANSLLRSEFIAAVDALVALAEQAPAEPSDERMADALQKIKNWSEAYPLEVFPEPDLKKAHEVLTANGMTLDAISAHAMRHVITRVQEIAVSALTSPAKVEPAEGWDASQIKQPGWHHVYSAFVEGAREARGNPDATDDDFHAASDGYTKRVFEEVDPVSEKALRTESWLAAAPHAGEGK